MTIFSNNIREEKLRGLAAAPYSRGRPRDGARRFSVLCALFLSPSFSPPSASLPLSLSLSLTLLHTQASCTPSGLRRSCNQYRTNLPPQLGGARATRHRRLQAFHVVPTPSATMDNRYRVRRIKNRVIIIYFEHAFCSSIYRWT